MQAALAGHDLLGLNDAEAHCVAAGLIARRCSVSESMLASLGKEIQDALGAGDAEWRDLSSDRHGIRCAKAALDAAALRTCCRTMTSIE